MKAKRIILAALMAVIIVSAFTLPAFAAENTTAYLKFTSDAKAGAYAIELKAADLTVGETYTISADIKFEGVTGTGSAYFNYYPYDTSDTLGAWADWATTVNDGTDTDWLAKSYSFTIDENFARASIQVGFYETNGTISVDNIKIVDSKGNVIFTEDWEDGMDTDVWYEGAAPASVELVNYTAPETSEGGTGNPETGDEVAVYAVLALVVLAAGIVTVKKVRG
ncbi:MAG TPA: hypothetical protein PLT66_08070 [Bacillota bacterium]|nr:hypothetical protein [Bacillota bacterium]